MSNEKPQPAGGQSRLGRPRVYGDDSKCRTALTRYIRRGEELLDQSIGVRKHIDSLDNEFVEFALEDEWGQAVRRWAINAARGLGPYLQEGFAGLLPRLAFGLPPNSGKPRHFVGLENAVPWIRDVLDELASLQAALGVRRDVIKSAPIPVRFAELRASGLVADKVVSDHERAMTKPRTAHQLANAIGSAKEIVEATLRAALTQLGQPYAMRDDLTSLMKKWRTTIVTLAPPDEQGRETLDQVQASLANIVKFLGEWRNPYGRGHGRPQYPKGLRPRHARLAIDVAETSVRFIVTTMDDLELLPP